MPKSAKPAASTSDTTNTTIPVSYEAALTELEALVQQMEAGAQSLEQSLAAYQRGAELVKYCQQALSAAEAQIKILEGDMMKPYPAARAATGNVADADRVDAS